MDSFDALLSEDLTDLFAVEQRCRRAGRLAMADRLVAHRATLLAGGAAALRSDAPLCWRTAPPLPQRAIWGHLGGVVAVEVDPDRTRLVSLGADRRLRVWEPDGRCVVDVEAEGAGLVLGGGLILVRRAGGEIRRWRHDGTPMAPLQMDGITDLALRDGQLTGLSEDGAWLSLAADGTILERVPLPEGRGGYKWRSGARLLSDGRVWVCISEEDPGGLYGPHEQWFEWSPASGAMECLRKPTPEPQLLGALVVHALPEGSLYLQPPGVPALPPGQHKSAVQVLGLTGAHLVSGGRHLQISDAETGAPIQTTEYHRDLDRLVLGREAVSLSRYVHQRVRAPTAKIWDQASWTCRATVSAGENYLAHVSASPDGRRLAWTDRETLYLAASKAPEAVKTTVLPRQPERDFFWAPDGSVLLLQLHGWALSAWDLVTQTRRILTFEVLRSAQFVLAADDAAVLADWSHYGFHILALDGRSLGGVPGRLTAWTFAAGDGARYGIAGMVTGGLLWLDFAQRRRGWLLKDAGRITLSTAAGQDAAWGAAQEVGLVDLAGRAVRWRRPLDGVSALAIGAEQVFVGDKHGAIVALSREDGTEERRWEAHAGRVCALAALPGGGLISGCEDGEIRRWPEGTRISEAGEGQKLYGFSVRGDHILLRMKEGQQLRRLSDGARLPLPAQMGRGRLVGQGTQAVSLDHIVQVEQVDPHTARRETLAAWGDWPPSRGSLPVAGALLRLEPDALVCRGGTPWRLPGCYRRLLWVSDDRIIVEAEDGRLRAVSASGAVCWEREGQGAWADLCTDGQQVLAVRAGVLLVLSAADGRELGCWRSLHRWTRGAVRGDRIAAGDDQGSVHRWTRRGGVEPPSSV